METFYYAWENGDDNEDCYESEGEYIIVAFATEPEIKNDAITGPQNWDDVSYEKKIIVERIFDGSTLDLCEDYLIGVYCEDFSLDEVNEVLQSNGFKQDKRIRDTGWS